MERARSPRPFSEPRLLLKGFFSQRSELYRFDRFQLNLYLNDWEIEFRVGKINAKGAQHIVGDKLFFHLFMPRKYNGHFLGAMDRNGFRSFSDIKTLEEAIATHGRIFVKPTDGRSGTGILIADSADISVSSPHVVEAPIKSHGYASAIYPGSLNSIRVITLRDNDGCFIAGAAHRFGSTMTGHVDNFSKGGIAAFIDLKTGVMADGRSNPGVYSTSTHPHHPNTNVKITGTTIPGWTDVTALALELAALFPDLYYVGWDIAVTPDGPVMIEGNTCVANPNLIQAHKPLLGDKRVIRFMRHHKVISDRRAGGCQAIISLPQS